MKTVIPIDSCMSVAIENRATGQVKLSVDHPFLVGGPSISVRPDQAERLADALKQAAAMAKGEVKQS